MAFPNFGPLKSAVFRCVTGAPSPQSQIEELTKRIDVLTGARANSGRSLEDDLMASYQQLAEMEGQLINTQGELTYKTREQGFALASGGLQPAGTFWHFSS